MLRADEDYPVLPPSEIARLGAVVRGGSPRRRKAAAQKLVLHNLPLLVMVARRYARGLRTKKDLIADGIPGLLKASTNFDPSKGTFATIAAVLIWRSIQDHARDAAGVIRLPRYMRRRLRKWREASRALERELGRTPTSEEIAARLHLNEGQRLAVLAAIDVQRSSAGGYVPLQDLDHATGPAAAASREVVDERGARARRLLGGLDEEAKRIMCLRFGIDCQAHTATEIAADMGMDLNEVVRVIRASLAKMREAEGEVTG